MGLTAAEEAELNALKSDVSNPETKGLTPAEEQELAQLKKETGKPMPIDQMGPMDWVRAFGKGLNVMPGLVRTGAAKVKDLMGPGLGPEISKEDDLGRALTGTGPSTEEYLDRSGYKPGAGRSAAGLVGDMASDPLTYLTGGPVSKGLIKSGENIGKVTKATEYSLPAAVWAFTHDPVKAFETYVVEQALKNKTVQEGAKKGLIGLGKSGLADSAVRQKLKDF